MTENTVITFDGYTFDTTSRKVEFISRTCRNCQGNTVVEQGILCPRYGRKQRGKACQHCGSKSAHNHKSIGTKWVTCHTCEGKGQYIPNEYDSLNFSALVRFINIVTSRDSVRRSSFNEGYLGIGIIGGTTDYGRYLDETSGEIHAIIERVYAGMEERHRYSQGLNLLTKEGTLIEAGLLVLRSDGWAVYSIGASSSIYESSGENHIVETDRMNVVEFYSAGL